MKDVKPLLLGMNNPLSDSPEYDLYPYPEGSTGYRIWKMLPEGTTRSQYLEAFDRRNLLRSRRWDLRAARAAVLEVAPHLDGRVVVVLGTQVRAALGLEPVEPLTVMGATLSTGHSMTCVAVPHPSGRNYWYNTPGNRDRVCELLAGLMDGILPECEPATT